MKIITTPMCEDVLRLAGVKEYFVVKPDKIEDADVAVLLSETKSDIPKVSVKLNTYTQLYDSILNVCKEFNGNVDEEKLWEIKKYISSNDRKKDYRQSTKVKVYSNFLKDTILDMGFSVVEEDYDFIVVPDYMRVDFDMDEKVVVVASHKNVKKAILERINERYEYLEAKLCMKH